METGVSTPSGASPSGVAECYPAVHHFRIILQADATAAAAALEAVLADYAVTAPLQAAHRSAGGRYRSMQVSVRLAGREEHERLDASLRVVPGVRVLL